ncbi:kinesin-like protein KIF18A isoform X2 [Latimeria chalumnae]|uniref:Kinesin-like protein n=1 Tax=Latimeria chalumnae TaxID=7897 RepID=M3XJ11_LATCH|nr:PREDICTED: kinesin-like protein KIF18A isoform X2 [Latimeria chalumnae]|eukprot:XP_005995136.1 PREDICTED: kinesin-like protein KIF18A isoform X2 [Latimeria chalumnae]
MSTSDDNVCSHVKVVIRVRPENRKEQEGKYRRVVHVVDKHVLVFDPKEEEFSFFRGHKSKHRDISKRQNKDLKFVFDGVFDENATQLDIFEHTTKTIIDGFLNGYNCTVLAYGATGAGKTHTMLGLPSEPGVMYLTMMDLYRRIDQIKDEKLCEIAVSYLEVYNEQIHDLLSNSGPLAVREDSQKGVIVQGLTLHQPKSAECILELLDYGNKNRTQHPTDLNATSSRSHAVFQIYLRQRDRTASINQNVRIAKMSLIDLAGSERISAANGKRICFREGANINRSLLALGNVINVLADSKSKKQHIPYRNSKLTRLLKDSLGGNCRTVMIAAVSPSSLSYEDIYNTLKYANQAKEIRSSLRSNVLSLDSHISQYAKICEQQKREIMMLKEKLKAYEEEKVAVPESRRLSLLAISSQQQAALERFEEILKSLFMNRAEIRRDCLKLEMQFKVNKLKAFHQAQYYHRIQLLHPEEQAEKATCKRERRLASLEAQQVQIERRKQEVENNFEENNNWLHRVENEMRLLSQNGHIPPVLHKDLQLCHLQLEVKDLRQQIEHMMYLISLQEQENKRSGRLMDTLLPAFHKQYRALKEAELVNHSIDSAFMEVKQLVQPVKGVVWADQTVEEELEPKYCEQLDFSKVLAFSYLVFKQNTPCNSEKRIQVDRHLESKNESKSQPATFSTVNAPEKSKENIEPTVKDLVRRPIRRKLLGSSTAAEKFSECSQLHPLKNSFSEEGICPLQQTPENQRTLTVENCFSVTVKEQQYQTASTQIYKKEGFDGTRVCLIPTQENAIDVALNVTTECSQAVMDSTVVLGVSNQECDSVLQEKYQPDSTGNFLERPGLPSLLNRNPFSIQNGKPSYMAMTFAAQRKRKLQSTTSTSALRENLQVPNGAKRVRQENLWTAKPLRVHRIEGNGKHINDNGKIGRKVVRSISEGNLSLVGAKEKKSNFVGSAKLFMHAPKKK